MKKRIMAVILAAVMPAMCFGCNDKKGTESSETSGFELPKAESYVEKSYSDDITYKLRDDFKQSGDSEREYTYDNMTFYIHSLKKCTTPEVMNDYWSDVVFNNKEVIVKEVFKSEKYDVSHVMISTEDEDEDYYDMFSIGKESCSFDVNIYHDKGQEQLAKELAVEILDSVEFGDSNKLPEGGGDFENDFFSMSWGERWYSYESRNKDSRDDGVSKEIRYKVSENLAEFFASVCVTPRCDNMRDSLEEYVQYEYETQKNSSMSSCKEAPRETEFHGDKAYIFEYTIDGALYEKVNLQKTVYFVEHSGVIYYITCNCGAVDGSEAVLSDIQEILDSIELKDVTHDYKSERIAEYSTESFTFELNTMFAPYESSSLSDDLSFKGKAVTILVNEGEAEKSMSPSERAEERSKVIFSNYTDGGEQIEYRAETFGDNAYAYVLDYFDDRCDFMDRSYYYLEENGKILVITICAPDDTQETYENLFADMLASVRYTGG